MSAKTIIFGIIGIIVVVSILIFFRILPGRQTPTPPNVELTFWGSKENQEIWREILQDFHEKFPHITVNYTQINEDTYEDTLINKIAEGKGPDVFMLSHTLLTKYRDKIYPLPQQQLAFSSRDFASTFVDGTYEQLVSPDSLIYGLPLFIDTPALFYNKDTLNAAGIARVPANWDDLIMISRSLTQKNAVGEIIKSGLPLGTSRTVNHSFEILSTLMFQQGDHIIEREQTLRVSLGDKATKALDFYTSFANPTIPHFSWSDRMPESLNTFSQSSSAFVIGFYDDFERIQAKNPHLNVAIAPFPQEKGRAVPVVYGRYDFPTVLKFSKNPVAAWQFVAYLASQEGASAYIAKTNLPPARRDLLSNHAPTAELEPFYRQALIAKSWLTPDNITTRRLFQDAIESVLAGTFNANQAIGNLKVRLELLLAQ